MLRRRHGDWDGHGRGLSAERRETLLVKVDALLCWLLLLCLASLIGRARIVLSVLLVWSSLVWILLRLVVAVLLILPRSTAPGRALLVVLHWLPLRLHGPSTHLLVLVLVVVLTCSSSLVVIPVHPRLVLGVLLLILLIPASACGGTWIAALPETTLVVVASTTLVAALAPAVSRLVVLVSLRVLS